MTQLETEINNIAASTQYGGTQVLQGANTFTQTLAESQAGIDSVNVSAAIAGNYSLTMTSGATGAGVTILMTDATQLGSQTYHTAPAQPTARARARRSISPASASA